MATKCSTPSRRNVWYAQRRIERMHLAAPTARARGAARHDAELSAVASGAIVARCGARTSVVGNQDLADGPRAAMRGHPVRVLVGNTPHSGSCEAGARRRRVSCASARAVVRRRRSCGRRRRRRAQRACGEAAKRAAAWACGLGGTPAGRTVPSSPRTRAGGLARLFWRLRRNSGLGGAAGCQHPEPRRKGPSGFFRKAARWRRWRDARCSYHTAGGCTALPPRCRLSILGLERRDGINVLLHRSLLGHACAGEAAAASARVMTSARGGCEQKQERRDRRLAGNCDRVCTRPCWRSRRPTWPCPSCPESPGALRGAARVSVAGLAATRRDATRRDETRPCAATHRSHCRPCWPA